MLGSKTSAILSALGLVLSSTMVFANTTTAHDTSLQVTNPDSRPRFEFSISALALKPGASNLNYVIYNKELPVQSPTWSEKEIRPGYGAAFELGGRYIFSRDNDISLDWTHLNSSTSTSIMAPSASFFLGPDYEIGPDGLPIRNATGNVQFKYDVINLDAGQFVDWGKHIQTRVFMGLSNAYLREQMNVTYSGETITGPHQGPFSTKQEVTANFTGIGPRFGIEANYVTDYGFGFLGEAAASALIGYTYSKTGYISSAQELKDLFGQNSNNQSITDQDVTQVIPGIDAKLGVIYKYNFNKCTLLTLEGGYQAAVYINAINQYLPASLAVPLETGGIFVATMSHTQSNYSVQGPFLKAALQF